MKKVFFSFTFLLMAFALFGQGHYRLKITKKPTPQPGISIQNLTVNEGDGSVMVSVKRSGPTTGTVTVSYATANGTATRPADYSGTASGTVTFGPGETDKAILVFIADDSDAEGSEAFYINLTNPVGGVLLNSQAVITILDNDGTQPFASITLDARRSVSAGVYNGETLVKTIMADEWHDPGPVILEWDGTDEAGNPVANPAAHTIKYLTDSAYYEWEGGMVGNTSRDAYGELKHQSFQFINSLAIYDTLLFHGFSYGEGGSTQGRSSLNDVQRRKRVFGWGLSNFGMTNKFVATNGTNVFWIGQEGHNEFKTFVVASRVSDDAEVSFSAGQKYSTLKGKTFASILDYTVDSTGQSDYSGAAVTAKYLFLARRGLNQIRVLSIENNSGAFVRNITVTNPKHLAVDDQGFLWVSHGSNSVSRYQINTDGTITATGATLAGLKVPVGLAAWAGKVVVLDAGSALGEAQVVRGFNYSGVALWTLGDQYTTSYLDATVHPDKFYFALPPGADNLNWGLETSVAIQNDGSFWVVDAFNYRVQHFAADRTYLETVSYIPNGYTNQIHQQDSTRIFHAYLEFKIDYTKPLGPANGSWTLAKNWGYGMSDARDYSYTRLKGINRMSNGKHYGVLNGVLAELVEGGTLRVTGVAAPSNAMLYGDDLYRVYQSGGVQYWAKRPRTGWAGADPVYSATETLLENVAYNSATDPWNFGTNTTQSHYEVTSSGYYISFQGHKLNTYGGRHLGAVKNGQWLWKVAPATHKDYDGPFPLRGAWYEEGGGTSYPGGVHKVHGRNVLFNMHNEFWNNTQTNYVFHYLENGLLVGVWGTDGKVSRQIISNVPPGMAGNVFYFSVAGAPNSSDLYLYNNDEGWHGAIHRRRVWNMGSLQEGQVPAKVFTKTKDYVDLMANLGPLGTVQTLPPVAGRWTRLPTVDSASFKVTRGKYGYDEPDLYIEAGNLPTSYLRGALDAVTSSNYTLSFDVINQGTNPQPQRAIRAKLLDGNLKVIANAWMETDNINTATYVRFMANNQAVYTWPKDSVEHVLRNFRSVSMTVQGPAAITVSYYGKTATLSRVDATADWENPRYVEFEAYDVRNPRLNQYGKHWGLQRVRIRYNAPLP